jgi:hypothetical protein
MTLTLDDSWTKFARGKEHLETPALECEGYLRAGPVFTAEVFYDPEASTVEPKFRADPMPPPRIGAIVGDVAHNLRSALDVAAWQLAIANDEDAAREQRHLVTFPLTRGSEDFRKSRALAFFSEPARLVIELLQPYQASMEALGWLRDLSNADKHRVSTFSFTGLTESPVAEAGVRAFSSLHVRFGTDEGHIGLIGLQAVVVSVELALREIEATETVNPT